MKLEINVPDICYENILNGKMDSLDVCYGLEAIKKGVPVDEFGFEEDDGGEE